MGSPVDGIDPGVDRTVGEHQRGDVVLEQGGQRADGRLVARDDRDDAGHVVGLEVRLGVVVHQLATGQRVAHPVGAVELAVGDPEGERRRDEANREVVVVDPLGQRLVHRVDLRPHAEVALAVAERADDAPHGVVHLGDVLAQEARGPDALDVASGIPRHELTGLVGHCCSLRRAPERGAAYPRCCRALFEKGPPMSVLVTTADGYLIFTSSGKELRSLEGHRVECFTPGPDGTFLAVIDRHEVWSHGRDGEWTPRAKSEATLTAVVAAGDAVFAGTDDAARAAARAVGRARTARRLRHRGGARRVAPGRFAAAGAHDDGDVPTAARCS